MLRDTVLDHSINFIGAGHFGVSWSDHGNSFVSCSPESAVVSFLLNPYIIFFSAANTQTPCSIMRALPSRYTWVCVVTFDSNLGSTKTPKHISSVRGLATTLVLARMGARRVGGSKCVAMEMEYNKVTGMLAGISCNKHSAWCLMKVVYRFQTTACPGNALEVSVCVRALFDTYKIL